MGNHFTPAPIDVAVVDDNRLIGQSVERWISGDPAFGFVGAFTSTAEALAALAVRRPRVLLLDVDMPGSDPQAFLTEIAARYPDVRVVMLSGHVQSAHIARALDNGAAGYIVKDEGMTAIMALVRRAAAGQVVLSPTAKGSLTSHRP